MSIARYVISVTVAGTAGSAAGSSTYSLPINGCLKSVYIDYTSQPSTTDVTITSSNPTQTLLTKSNANTDALFSPRVQCCDTSGTAITGWYDEMVICGYVTVTVAQGDPGSVEVILLVES